MKKLVFAALLTAFTGSCAFVMVGSAGMAGAYAWSQGELSRNYRQPLATSWEGVKHALSVSRLTVEEQAIDPHYGKIVASAPGGEEQVTVSLEKWTKTETRVTVRMGVMGDRAKSERIHEEIEKALR
jgi:hypothetical protein